MASASSWLALRAAVLPIEAKPALRNALTTWLRQYGETNGIPGLSSGRLETRLAQLRRVLGERHVVVWTTPARWATGEGLTLRLPVLGIDVACVLADGSLRAEGLALSPPDALDAEDEPGSVGAVVQMAEIAFSTTPRDSNQVGATLEQHFKEHAVDRWTGFARLLGAVLEEEARDERRRQTALTCHYRVLTPAERPGAWNLSDLEEGSSAGYEPGEWVEIVRPGGAVAAAARVARVHPWPPALEVDAPSFQNLPTTGTVRPRPQDKIQRQKQALIRQIANPTGDQAPLVELVAAPDLAAVPVASPGLAFINPLVGRVPSQANAVALALGLGDGQALLIQGPPGTGKSTTAAEIDLQLIRRNRDVRILVCSHSNHGTDNLLMKVLPFVNKPSQHLARVGLYERMAPAVRAYFVNSDRELGTRNLVFTTIDSLVLQDLAGARIYDYVILDEANRATVLDSLLALARGKRYILVGDQMQLQPVLSEAAERAAQANSHPHGDVVNTSLFAWLMARGFPLGATVLLDEQNRMHPAIAEVVSRVFYGGRVRSGPAAPAQALDIPGLSTPVAWIDTSRVANSQESRRGTSLVNLVEAELVARLAEHVATFAPPGLSIGVISAYASQRDVLRSLLMPGRISEDRQLEVDTVDAFEGREKDIILLSLVRSNARREVGFLRLQQRLNVAVSRPRRLLVVVGHVETLRGGYFDELRHAIGDVGTVLRAADLATTLKLA